MSSVKRDNITSETFPHQIPKGPITCADEQMDTVGHQHPCITPAASKRKILFYPTKKVIMGTVSRKISWRFKPLVMT